MSTLNIGRIFGIEIKLHYTWFFIIFLLAWSLAIEYFPAEYPGFSTTVYWILGFLAALLLFDSVLLHELSHSLVAKYQGMKVDNITLFFFGGIASTSDEGLTPKKEFLIAGVGPLFSLGLAGIFYALTLLPLNQYVFPIVDYLFKLNVILALFNLIPGFPLDGGRVFRSIVWKFTNEVTATRIAGLLGKAFAMLLLVWGLINIFSGKPGIWYVLIGSFLYVLADASYQQVLLKNILEKVKITRVMRKKFIKVNPDESIENFVNEHVMKKQQYFIVNERDEIFLLNFDLIKKIPRYEWPVRLIRDIMIKVKPLREKDTAYQALIKIQEQKANMLPVVKNKKVVGIVTINTLIRPMKS